MGQELLVIPSQYIDELKSLPEEILSSSHAVSEVSSYPFLYLDLAQLTVPEYFVGSYTTMNLSMMGAITWHVVRNRLTQSLFDLVAPLEEACFEAFEEYFPFCQSGNLLLWQCYFFNVSARKLFFDQIFLALTHSQTGRSSQYTRRFYALSHA